MHRSPTGPTLLSISLFLTLLCVHENCAAQKIVAHRGASYDAPENTIAAFQLAWEKGADAIEGDFYLTADDEIVCLHDKSTKRVAPGQTELIPAKSTLAELQKLDVGSWKNKRYADQRMPTLGDVLAVVPDGKQILVEIKCGPEIVPTLKRQLNACSLKPEQIIIIAFSKEVAKACRAAMPHFKCNWLTSYKRSGATLAWSPSDSQVLQTLSDVDATGLGSNGNESVVDQEFVEQVHKAGREFHVWTVNDPSAAKRFAAMGVDSITTDRPGLIRSTINESTVRKQPAAVAPQP